MVQSFWVEKNEVKMKKYAFGVEIGEHQLNYRAVQGCRDIWRRQAYIKNGGMTNA